MKTPSIHPEIRSPWSWSWRRPGWADGIAAFAGLVAWLAAGGTAGAIPVIITQPQSVRASLNATVEFRVAGTSPYGVTSYQWLRAGVEIPDATNSVLRLVAVGSESAGVYRARVGDSEGEVLSAEARLEVDARFVKVLGQPLTDDVAPSISATWCDYDGDGWMDVMVNRFAANASLTTNTLYRNLGQGQFVRVSNLLSVATINGISSPWGDYDNDGRPDVALLRWRYSGSAIYHNQGGDLFSQVVTPLDQNDQNIADAAWSDWDRDGFIDLLVNRDNLSFDRALRNLGGTGFALLTTNEVGSLLAEKATKVAAAFCDYDNDGSPDVYVACESGVPYLHHNLGEGRFAKVFLGSVPGGASTVSAAWADYDNDGWFDLFTSSRRAAVALHRNLGAAGFQDVTLASGLSSASSSVWGPAWGDFDNDGDLDLFLPRFAFTNTLYVNRGDGTFVAEDVGGPVHEGVQDATAAWVDFDNDGFLDLFYVCGEVLPTRSMLFRNNLPAQGNTHHWLKVQLRGVVSNRLGIGAKVRVQATIGGREVSLLRQIASNGALASGSELLAHFGLGDAVAVQRVRIEWPSGLVQELEDVPADQSLTIVESGQGLLVFTPEVLVRAGVSVTNRIQFVSTSPLPVTLQWLKNGVPVPGATESTLVLGNIGIANEGAYALVADQGGVSYTSSVSQVTILMDPTILVAPASQAVVPGDSVVFSVVFDGNPAPFGVEWRKGYMIVASNTVSTRFALFAVTNVQTSSTGTWRVIIRNAANNTQIGVNRTFTLNLLPDADGDRIPDEWELAYGLNPEEREDAAEDYDCDRLSNLQEYEAGTNPTNGLSGFRIESLERAAASGPARLTFEAMANRTYAVQACDVLVTGVEKPPPQFEPPCPVNGDGSATLGWRRLADVPASPTNRWVTVVDAEPGTHRFYRLVTPWIP